MIAAARLSREADKLGRFSSVRILPPKESEPELDRRVAKELGVSERMVRSIRCDKRISELLGTPTWEVPGWRLEAAHEIELRERALTLVTPERLAKGDLYLRHGDLAAKQVRIRAGSAEDAHMTAGGLLELQKWMTELLPSEYWRRPYWLAWSPAAMEANRRSAQP